MKKVVYGLVLAIGMTLSTGAFAAWCRAESPSAWGEGYGPTVDAACAIALRNCSFNTPYYQSCYVVNYSY